MAESLPNRLVIGPQRAGTTWIHRYLEHRGDVCLPRGVKETFFFDRSFERGQDWYASHFQPSRAQTAVIEVASTYFHSPDAPPRIEQSLGDIPLLCTLRDPVDRIYSLYLHFSRIGKTRTSFRQALRDQPHLLDSSRYATNLRRWFDVFGRDRVGVVFLHTLSQDTDEFAAQICDHFALPPVPVPDELKRKVNSATVPTSQRLAAVGMRVADSLRHVGLYGVIDVAKRLGLKKVFFGSPGTSEVPTMNPDDLLEIRDVLYTEVEELETLLERDLSEWKDQLEELDRPAEVAR